MPHRDKLLGGWTVRLGDVDQLSKLFGDWQGWCDQISPGRFEATLRVVRGETARAFSIRGNQRVRIRGGDAARLVGIHPVTAGAAASLWQGRSLSVGQVVLVGADTEVDYTSPRLTTHQAVELTPDELDDAVRVLLCQDGPGLPRGWAAVTPPPDAVARIDRLLTQFIRAGISTRGQLGTPEGRMGEQELVRAVVTALADTGTAPPDLSPPARYRLVLGAEEMMRAQLADPFGSIDLCRRLRVSDRTLRLAFRERYGMGPMAYFKSLRLNAVRAALKAERQLAVAAAAARFGFHHMGNFAADYRRLFGESPSDTAR